MLEHKLKKNLKPKRVIILGKNSFIGKEVIQLLKLHEINFKAFGKKDIDLEKENSYKKLSKNIKEDDCLILISARVPVKNIGMFKQNLSIIESMIKAINIVPVQHVINISSDAVYEDILKPMNENSKKSPNSLHGLMHLTRETLLKENVEKKRLAILCPTLIYGKNDPHDGYGPNKFYRLIKENKDIILFGKGEERRDHVFVEDVAKIILYVILRKSYGSLNIATGILKSFNDCAQLLKKIYKKDINIIFTKRVGEMPHNGYRAFNIKHTKSLFPGFQYTKPVDGFKKFKE
ncbi:MAG: NAD-dependent dehydratase [Rickettsiales bacterium]|nr:NAD-dependent dehydratase [Rickettsiales bacterium]|tara:strand:+ start:1377 stop:2249 length:873 start_codon:yes stop_codon:yes gene_type:complete